MVKSKIRSYLGALCAFATPRTPCRKELIDESGIGKTEFKLERASI
jgi:hypothetical protein